MQTLAQRMLNTGAINMPLHTWEALVADLTPADHYFLDMCSDDELGQLLYNDEEEPYVNDNSEIADRLAELVANHEAISWD